jgi:hypothetical protein
MENKPPFNRDLVIPIAIGGISIIGILVALLIGRSLSSPPQVPMTASATPFEFIFLGTEPAITTPLVEGSEIATLPEDSFQSTSVVLPPTSASAPPPLILTQPNTTGGAPTLVFLTSTAGGLPTVSDRTATATSGTAAPASTYDDNDPRFVYTGNWTSQSNVAEAYQGTLHISNTLGDTVTFTFTGSELHLFYQAGPSLGSVAITIDNAGPPPFSQAESETQIREWFYQLDTAGTHSIVLQHFSGGSVNIDSIFVPGPTPTPTRTATSTQ